MNRPVVLRRGGCSAVGWLAIALLAGCGGGSDRADAGADVDARPPPADQINGMPASEFFAQLAWETTRTGVHGAAAFPPATDGRNAFVVSFFLMPGGALTLFYGEGEGSVSPPGWSVNLHTPTLKRRTGEWRVEGVQLVVGTWMRCDGVPGDGPPSLRCTLTSSVVSPAAVGQTGSFGRRIGASTPADSEFADYMP